MRHTVQCIVCTLHKPRRKRHTNVTRPGEARRNGHSPRRVCPRLPLASGVPHSLASWPSLHIWSDTPALHICSVRIGYLKGQTRPAWLYDSCMTEPDPTLDWLARFEPDIRSGQAKAARYRPDVLKYQVRTESEPDRTCSEPITATERVGTDKLKMVMNYNIQYLARESRHL